MGILKVCFVGPKTIQTLFIQKTEYRLPKTNPNKVLAELKEYATEVDVDFVRKAVRAIGRCAIKVKSSDPLTRKPTISLHWNNFSSLG